MEIKAKKLLSFVLAAILMLAVAVPTFAEEKLSVKNSDTSVNEPFNVENMFPGDSVTKDFLVSVKHRNPIILYYKADILPGSEKLAEVMMVKIELPEKGILLYEGLMRDMPSALEYNLAADEKEVLYRITAYLDTSVGNDYQNKTLVANFRWWYMDEPSIVPVYVKIVGQKTVGGSMPKDGEFTFVLTDEKGEVVETVTNKNGYFEFKSLGFSGEGRYIYYLSEQKGNDPYIEYDNSVYKVIIDVTFDGNTYFASVSYEKGNTVYKMLPKFENIYIGAGDYEGNPDTGGTGLLMTAGAAVLCVVTVFVFFKSRGRREAE